MFYVMEGVLKALFLFLALILCVFMNSFLPTFIYLPSWYSFASHFFIAGILFSYFVVEFWIWFDRESFYRSKPFLRFLGILAGNALGGIFWEIFEYWYSQGAAAAAAAGNGAWFYSDTIWDLQMNFLGALIVVLIYCKKQT